LVAENQRYVVKRLAVKRLAVKRLAAGPDARLTQKENGRPAGVGLTT